MSAKTKPAQSPEPAAAAVATNLVHLSIPTPAGDEASESNKALIYAEGLAVVSSSDSAKAQEVRAQLNTRIKTLDDARKTLTRPIDAAKKTIMDFFAGPIATLTKAKGIVDAKVIAWDAEQERLRRIEQARLDKIAEDERKRLQAIADDAKRKADAEAEQLRKDAEAAAAAGRAEEALKLQAKATRVEEKADAKVETFETRASSVVAPIAQANTARVAGTQFRDHYEFEILDATKINASFMTPDLVKIGTVVKSLKGEAVGVVGAGLKVTSRKIMASGRT
jgi:uncharacterized membrane protein YqiK